MKSEEITPDIVVKNLDSSVFEMCFRDIEKASIYGEAKMAGFILGACFIDTLAGYYAGLDDPKKQGSGIRFKEFVDQYLKKYDSEKLYTDLRCGLVHSYTVHNGTFAFTDANKAGFHFDKTPRKTIILNLEDFVIDIKEAYRLFRSDILSGGAVFDNAKKRLIALGTMGVHLINMV